MRGITTHVLDLTSGTPAYGVRVRLERVDSGMTIGEESTDEDGRARSLAIADIERNRYRRVSG